MNVIFHALLGLLLVKLFAISHVPNILIGVLFSVFPDFDHVPHLKKALKTRRFGVESRSPLHESPGIIMLLLGSLVTRAFYPHLFILTLSCGLSHFACDFLTRPCRPLYPFSAKKFDLHLYPRELQKMFALDAILTLVLGLIYLIYA